MRVIAGRFRGTRLAAPGTAGGGKAHLRPTSDRVREAIFNMLAHGDYPAIEGARVLDLFAGTGALGIEALSRGAAQVTFVDDGVKTRSLIRENIEKCRAQGVTRLYRRDATRLGQNRGSGFDLVFLDPPYGKDLGAQALAAAQDGGWLAPGALIVWEESSPQAPPAGFTELDARKYGDTYITILRAAATETP